ncbi:WhiB family transcriptional regulator [Rhodococcus erythropolis]
MVVNNPGGNTASEEHNVTVRLTNAGVATLTPSISPRVEATSSVPCHFHDPEMWFATDRLGLLQAISLCRTCPQLAPCLTGALERKEATGVWGGRLLAEGKIVALPQEPPDYPGHHRFRNLRRSPMLGA